MTDHREPCVCGEPAALGTVHRSDGPCYAAESADQPSRRDRIAAAIGDYMAHSSSLCGGDYDAADAVLAVLPAPVDRASDGIDWKAKYELEHARHVAVVGSLVADPAAVLRGAADDWTARCPDHSDAEEAFMDCPCDWAYELRRMAEEAQQPEAPHLPATSWIVEYKSDGSAWLHLGNYSREGADVMILDLTDQGMETRLIRATTTYTVEAEAQQPEEVSAPQPVVCEGFQWIGQSFATCDRCGQPAWEHAGEDVPVEGADLFDDRRTVRPWKPGEADAIRAKWSRPTP